MALDCSFEWNNFQLSDDLFDVATQLIDEPEKDNSNEDLNATEVFDMPTQMLEVQENPQRNRLPAVLTQSSQPANTPGSFNLDVHIWFTRATKLTSKMHS